MFVNGWNVMHIDNKNVARITFLKEHFTLYSYI